ncbi:MAG: acyltransferase [Pseudomonadota bacterium]
MPIAHVTPEPPTLAEAGDDRSHAIDILRALAALAVVIYHARKEFWVGMQETLSVHGLHSVRPDIWLSYASIVFSFGWMGVPIFFVLSGYCIHLGYATKLRRSTATALNVPSFYKRRFLRIYPVYVAALLLTAVVDYFAHPVPDLPGWVGANLSSFVLNLLMMQELFVSCFGSNGVFWTLSIEFHLYLFYPVLFLLFRRYGPGLALAFSAAVSVLTGFAYWAFDLQHLFVHARGGSPLFTSHLFLWTAGAYLAEIKVGRAAAPRGLLWHLLWIAALIAGVILAARSSYAWSPIFLAIGAFGLVSVAIPAITRLCRRNSIGVRAFYLIGVASYSLYATHVPVFHAIKAMTGQYRSDTVLWAFACTVIAIGFSLLFFHLVERYTIRARSGPRQGAPGVPAGESAA